MKKITLSQKGLFFSFLFILSTLSINAQCVLVPGQNTIYGIAWDDNGNGTIQPGELGIPNIGVDLYLDTNSNGIIDIGETIVASTTTSSVVATLGEYTLVPPTVTLNENVADFFNFASYGGNNGSVNWSDNWQEVGENDGVSVGNIKVVNALRFGRNALIDTNITGYGALREVDLSIFVTAELSFNFISQINSPASQYFSIDVQVSSDGITYTTLDNLTFSSTNQNYTYDIASYISSNTFVRFLANGIMESNKSNYLYIDDVDVTFTKPDFFPTYIVTLDDATTPPNTSSSTPTYIPVTFTGLGEMSCDNNFGLVDCGTSCAPEANDDFANAEQGGSVSVNVLSNDTEGNSPIDISSVTIVAQPLHGAVTITLTGEVIYVPNSSFFGSDSFTYQICDTNIFTPFCDSATVSLTVTENIIDACLQAAKNHTYYIPFSDDELRTAFDNSDSGSCPVTDPLTNTVNRITSIKSPYPGNVIIYDHWEDGYEADIRNPIQSTTLVWGDNDPINGVAPGYSTDYIPSGGNFVLENTYNYNPRNSTEFFYDGKDKVFTAADIAISTVAGDTGRFEVQAAKTDIYDTAKFGTSFTVPFGEELGNEFSYTSLFIRASVNNTTVNVDLDNDGLVDSSATLNEGEVHFIDGGVDSGALITSTEPVGVDLFFGGLDCFGTRQINLYPAIFYSDTYYSPVPTTNPSSPAVVYFYNNLTTPIAIDWSNGIPNNGTVNVGAKSSASLTLSDNSAYRFTSQGGEPYVASEVIDSDAAGSTYDWAFNLISEDRLTDFAAIAWAPGSIDNSVNHNPVWVTPIANTTIYVKFDGDFTSGAPQEINGIPYDTSYPVNELDYIQIFDTVNADNDQSGLAVFTADGTQIFAVYGEDPNLAGINSPSIDVGTTMQPLCLQPKVFAIDDIAYGISNTSLSIPVLFNDTKFLTNIDVTSVSTTGLLQPTNGSTAVNPDGTITYIPNTGFVGVDTLEYLICSTGTVPQVCDTGTVIVNISDCPAPTNKNLVFGQVYIDSDEDGINNDGLGIENVDIKIYEDLNLSGTIDGGDIPLPTSPTTTTDINGNYQFEVPSYNTSITDDFSSNNFSGGSGWNGDWIETGESDGPTTGDVDIDTGQLKVENNKSAYRAIDLGDTVYATISFEISELDELDSNDEVKVEICPDNTFASCQTLFFRADDFTSASVAGVVINTNLLTSTAHLRIITDGYTSSDEEVFIDDISIFATVQGKNLLMEVDLTTVSTFYTLSTDNIEEASFTTGISGNCDQANDFGFLGCKMTDPGLNVICNDSGTPLDASDDTYTFTLNPSGVRFGGTYNVTGDVIGSGTYGVDTAFGPFPSTDGTKVITIADTSGNCEIVDLDIGASVSDCLSANNESSSIDFDGIDDYIEVPTSLINNLDVYTISFWLKPNELPTGGVFDKTFVLGQKDMFEVAIGNGNDGLPYIWSRHFYGAGPSAQGVGHRIDDTSWLHYTAVVNYNTESIAVYINGEPRSGLGLTGNTRLTNANPFRIGSSRNIQPDPDQENFNGWLDEVRIFIGTLTPSQIQRMVYQEIKNEAGNIGGTIINKEIVDVNTGNSIPWANLISYYPMANVANGKVIDESSFTNDGVLYNITTLLPQTAPMPYETFQNGDWTAEATWLHGDVWDIEDIANNKDWSIVQIHDNVTTTDSHTQLGLIIDDSKTLTVSGENALTNFWYLELNGTINLLDDSQLVQGMNSDLVTSVNGKILRRQEGTSNYYRYNYWSSPVGVLATSTLTDNNTTSNNDNNTAFKLNMLKNGPGVSDFVEFTAAHNETGKVSTEWLYTFQNGQTYYNWNAINPNSDILPGFGYTQKGTGNDSNPDPLITEQQYIFEGKPNNGTILIATDDVDNDDTTGPGESIQGLTLTSTLIGNPYPSALDARQFINDNLTVINGNPPAMQGTILLWEQWAGNSHYLAEYQGGYGFINLSGTVRAYQHANIPIAGQTQTEGIKRPTYYIPVGQGFSVEIINDGHIEFNNSQRVFIKESDLLDETDPNYDTLYETTGSSFLRSSNTDTSSDTKNRSTTSPLQLIRMEFATSEGSTRRFALGFGDHTTDGLDYGYDGGLILDKPEDDMGSSLDGGQYVIQAFAPITDGKEVDLTLNASGNFSYSLKAIELKNIADDQEIYLRDNLTGSYFDLTNDQAYNFTSNAGEFNDRFDVVFQSGDTLSNEDFTANNIVIYVNNIEDMLYVKGLTAQAKQVSLVNMLGQIIKTYNNIDNQTLENGINISNLSSGTYVVSVLTENNQTIDKKVIIN